MFINKETIYYGNEFPSNVPTSTLSRTKLFDNQDLTVLNKKVEIKERNDSEFYDKIKFLIIHLILVGILPVCKPGEGRFNVGFKYCNFK